MIIKTGQKGRIILPEQYMKALQIENGSDVEVILGANELIIKKVFPGCIFCNSAANLLRVGRLYVCRQCIDRLGEAKENDFLYPFVPNK